MPRQIFFRQRDLAAALKAMAAAGIEVRAVEIDQISGKIVILTIAGSDNLGFAAFGNYVITVGKA